MTRSLDFIAAMLLIAGLFPFLAVIALLVRLKLGKPVFFLQSRAGINGAPFKIVKFRTMVDGNGSDFTRLTKFGELLRSYSIDELPELWNVLKGDMSLVGPRPLLLEYLPLFNQEQARRQEVRPGITGWAQVNGRNGISWEDKFQLDVWYIDNRSLWLDIKILCLTVKKVLVREGINATGDATMPLFKGKNEG